MDDCVRTTARVHALEAVIWVSAEVCEVFLFYLRHLNVGVWISLEHRSEDYFPWLRAVMGRDRLCKLSSWCKSGVHSDAAWVCLDA